MRKFSIVISRTFDFHFWAPLILIISLLNSGLSTQQVKILFILLGIIDVLFPIILFFYYLKTKRISDIDVTIRQERHKLFAVVSLFLLLGTTVSFSFGNQEFFILHLTVFMMTLTILCITFFYKISAHLFMAAGTLFLINFLLDWHALWLFILLLPIAFARFYLKKHDMPQILLGSILGILEPMLILKLNGYL